MSPAESGQFHTTILGLVAVLLAAASWGASGVFVKLIMAAGPVSSLSLAFWRDSAAFVLFFSLALSINRGRITIQRTDWPALVGMGISLGVFHVFLNLGYRLNGAAITTIQQAAMPAIVLVLARVVWKEPLTRVKLLSLMIIGLGAALVSGLLDVDAADVSAGSILIGFLVPTFYAGWSLFGKALRTGYSAVVILAWAFGIAASVLLPFQLASSYFLPPLVPIRSLLWFGGLTGISTVFAFFAFTFALGRLPAGIASILVMSEIAFAVFYAYVFLNESLSLIEISGAIVIVVGVIVLLTPGPVSPMVKPATHQ